MTTTSDRAGDW